MSYSVWFMIFLLVANCVQEDLVHMNVGLSAFAGMVPGISFTGPSSWHHETDSLKAFRIGQKPGPHILDKEALMAV